MDDRMRYRWAWRIAAWTCLILHALGLLRLFICLRRQLGKRRVFVLTYHRITDRHADPDIEVRVRTFERQVDYLQRHFRVIPLSEALEASRSGGVAIVPDRRNIVAITFDDGYADSHDVAMPILRARGLSATFFVITGQIGRRGFLSAGQIRNLAANGMEIGSHTVSHSRLCELDSMRVQNELVASKQMLEAISGNAVRFLAYPFGKPSDVGPGAPALAPANAYLAAFGTHNGVLTRGADLFKLPRMGVRECPDYMFAARLAGLFEVRVLLALRRLVHLH